MEATILSTPTPNASISSNSPPPPSERSDPDLSPNSPVHSTMSPLDHKTLDSNEQSPAETRKAADTIEQDPEQSKQEAETREETKEEIEDAEEEEEECGFCLFMKGGGCKESFVAWEKCIEEAEKSKEDIVQKCFDATDALKKCMEAHPDYYEPILRAEKVAEEEATKEVEKEKTAWELERNSGSETIELVIESNKADEKTN